MQMVECAKQRLDYIMKAQSDNVDNIVLQGRKFEVSFASSKFRGWNFYKDRRM